MADTSHGSAVLRIAIGFAIGAAVGFVVANSMSPKTVPSAPPTAQVPATPVEAADEAEELSDAEVRRAMAAVDARPTDFEAQFKMGEALLRISRRPSDAVRYYERAVTLQPRSAEALIGLGDANFAVALGDGDVPDVTKRLDAARSAYERALALEPGNAGVLAALGSTFALRKPPVVDKARAAFERALALDPKNALARRGLADLGAPATNGNVTRTTPPASAPKAPATGR